MTTPLSDQEIERLARKRAGAKLGWYVHLTVYLLVNALLFVIASQGAGNRQWSIYPALGWGLGLVLHGVSVFMLGTGGSFRESLVQKERERLQRDRNGH